MWHTRIVEGFTGGNAQADGLSCVELTKALTELTAAGWTPKFVTPNGVNRWTVVCWKDA